MKKFLLWIFAIFFLCPAFGDGEIYSYDDYYNYKKTPQQKVQDIRNANNPPAFVDMRREYRVPTAEDVLGETGKCIHVSDIGIKAAVRGMAFKYGKPNAAEREQEMLDVFYQKYDTASAEICVGTVLEMCKKMLGVKEISSQQTDLVEKCKDLKKYLVYTMQFPASCAGGGGNCNKQFANGIKVQQREGKGLIELWTDVKQPGKSVYCSNSVREYDYQDYLGCKITDGTNFWNYEFEFDSLDRSIDSSIRNSVIEAGVPTAWPGKTYDTESGYYGNKKATVKDVSKAECEKFNQRLKISFGGYSKSVGNNCETMWHPNYKTSLRRDFDDKGFGTSVEAFRELQIKNVNELDQLFTAYLTNKAEQRGRVLTDIHCDKSPGNFEKQTKDIDNYMDGATYKTGVLTRTFGTEEKKYISCYGTYEGTVLQEDFVFTDTSEASQTRASAGLSGFKCVTKNGGMFDGEHCAGISKEVCEKEPKTRWDKDLEVCVLEDAELISKWDYARNTTIKWVSTVAGVAIAVVAAVPTGGTSVMGVVAALGVTTAAVGQGISQYSQDEANKQIQDILIMVGPYKTSCERNGEDCALCVHGLTMGAMAFGSLLNSYNSAATDEALASCTSKWVDNDPESFEIMAQKLVESGITPEKLKGMKSTGDMMMLIGGAVAFAAGLTKLAGFDKIIPDKSPSKITMFFDKLTSGFNKTKVGQGVKKVTDTKVYEKTDFAQQQVRYGKGRMEKLIDYSTKLEKTLAL